jgi:hypothetical protein
MNDLGRLGRGSCEGESEPIQDRFLPEFYDLDRKIGVLGTHDELCNVFGDISHRGKRQRAGCRWNARGECGIA